MTTRRRFIALLVSVAPVLTALSAAPAKSTEILWDRYGVAHIFAPDHASLFYAYGYAQMEAHSALLIRLYQQSRGRAAGFTENNTSSLTSGFASTVSPRARSNGQYSSRWRSRRCSRRLRMA